MLDFQMQTMQSLKASDIEMQKKFKLKKKKPSLDEALQPFLVSPLGSALNMNNNSRNEQQKEQQLDPFQFTRTVIENCGQRRFKDKMINKTERG